MLSIALGHRGAWLSYSQWWGQPTISSNIVFRTERLFSLESVFVNLFKINIYALCVITTLFMLTWKDRCNTVNIKKE